MRNCPDNRTVLSASRCCTLGDAAPSIGIGTAAIGKQAARCSFPSHAEIKRWDLVGPPPCGRRRGAARPSRPPILGEEGLGRLVDPQGLADEARTQARIPRGDRDAGRGRIPRSRRAQLPGGKTVVASACERFRSRVAQEQPVLARMATLSGRMVDFPEVDRAAGFRSNGALRKKFMSNPLRKSEVVL